MNTIRLHPLDMRREAVSALARLAYRGDDVRAGDVRRAAEYYSKKYNIDLDRFSGMIEAYEYFTKRFTCDETELTALFSNPEDMETNINDILTQIRFNFGDERMHDLNLRIGLFLSDEKDEPAFEHSGVSDLFAYLERSVNSADARWLLGDAIIRFEDYLARADRLIDQAETILRDVSHLLIPYAEHSLQEWNALQSDEAFWDRLATNGFRSDCREADVYPLVFMFTSISLHSNIISADYFHEKERSIISYGVLIDDIGLSDQSLRDQLEIVYSVLHALDDKKRLQILSSLRTRPLYGQELAGMTELSPATISHHMGELAGSGLVTIEKQGVKLLYHLNETRIREFTTILENTLLR